MTTDLEVNLTKTIPAPRKDVFNAWLDPKVLARFMTPGPGMTVPKAETDPKPGGKFLIIMKAGDTELPHSGIYKTVSPYETIAFTWVSPHSQVDSLVTLNFKALSDSETELTLKHVGFADETSRGNHEGGWGAILNTLQKALS